MNKPIEFKSYKAEPDRFGQSKEPVRQGDIELMVKLIEERLKINNERDKRNITASS